MRCSGRVADPATASGTKHSMRGQSIVLERSFISALAFKYMTRTALTPIPGDAREHPPVLHDEGDVLNVGHGVVGTKNETATNRLPGSF